jgi:hypothetical protein
MSSSRDMRGNCINLGNKMAGFSNRIHNAILENRLNGGCSKRGARRRRG